MAFVEHKDSSKFDGVADRRLAAALYDVTMISGQEDELGDVGGFGWYGFIRSRKPGRSYIVGEDNYGFFDYQEYSNGEGDKAWEELQKEYDQWCANTEDE